jgi:ADP-ribose pyrophosphatase
MSDDARLKILSRETAYRGYFRIERFTLRHEKHDGTWSGEMVREVFQRGDAAGALLYDPDRDDVVLVEQFRLPAHVAGRSAWQLEVVAGIIEEGETPEAVTLREIREESGLEVNGAFVPIHSFLPTPGGSTETMTLFCARVDSSSAGGIFGVADEHEDIRVVVLPFAEAMERARAGVIENGFTLLALWWLLANRERLRKAWPDR